MTDRTGDSRRDAPGLIAPMLATPGPVPTGSEGWAFEIKFDGVRAIGYAGPSGLRLFSRNDRDVSASYPEVGGLQLPRGSGADALVVDGELVALDERGRPDFERLQQRMHLGSPSAALIEQVPVRYVVFDLLRLDGRPLLAAPYAERRARLVELGLPDAGVVVPANFTDTLGPVVLAAAEQQGLEGVVAKRIGSGYQPGRRSRSWIKTPIRRTSEVIIAGWSPGSGGRRGGLGSLLLAAHDTDGELVYVGDVGTGFSDAARLRLLELLRPLQQPTPPFRREVVRTRVWPGRPPGRGPVHWVEPQLVGEIEYRAFTRDRSFRHPSWRGLRPDRDPDTVNLPEPT